MLKSEVSGKDTSPGWWEKKTLTYQSAIGLIAPQELQDTRIYKIENLSIHSHTVEKHSYAKGKGNEF